MKTFQQYISMDEAWTADSVVKNATIGSKKGYGINIKKGGGVTKTPYKHMLLTNRSRGNVRVTFDHGDGEFEGTPQSVALHINKKLGIKESVELDEWGTPADLDAYSERNQKRWKKDADERTRKQMNAAMKTIRAKAKKKKKK